MKRFLLLLALMVAFSGNANATRRTATFGDKNTSDVYRLRADTDTSQGTNWGWVTFAANTGIKFPYQVNTSGINQTIFLVTADSGSYITDFGNITPSSTAAASISYGNTYVLPPSAVGMVYRFATGVKETITIHTFSSSDGMLYTVSGTQVTGTTGVKNTTVQAGDTITFACSSAGTWSVFSKSGTWQ